MSKKKKGQQKETNIENFYDLRTDAVDELVDALRTGQSSEEVSTNIQEITGEQTDAKPGSKKAEFNPYKRDKLAFLPTWLKAIFIKWWFAGAVCYFIMMGLGYYILNGEDLWYLAALVYGIVVDIFVNPIFRFIESDEKEYDNYMMFPFPFKCYWTFITNIIYYVIVMFAVGWVMTLIKLATGLYAIEPLIYATLTVAVDMAFIGVKDGIVYGVKKSKKKKAEAKMLEAEIAAEAQKAEQPVKVEKSAEALALDSVTEEVLGKSDNLPKD